MQSAAATLQVDNLSNPKQAYSNRVFVNPEVFAQLERLAPQKEASRDPQLLVSVSGHVYFCAPDRDIAVGKISLNQLQRKAGQFMLNQSVTVEPFTAGPEVALASITLKIDLLSKNKAKSAINVDGDQLSKAFQLCFGDHVLELNQEVAFDFQGMKFVVTVESLDHAQLAGQRTSKHLSHGQLLPVTDIVWARGAGAMIQLSGSSGQRNALFSGGFNFEKLGIGGLQHEFEVILRRAFASRIFPSQIVKQLGVNHVRGMLLYGPPGCGKTLIARQIGKVLNAREPKIVNGPEILDKYVGGSEEKIRELFADAEREQQMEGDNSMLHIIIFDEIDAICKSRGTVRDGTGVSDSIVNQLLSKIDGVDSLNNILIIGMTNRKDMIDEALLRPGRLEVHVEIGLPDQNGRLQILNIHTGSMRQHNRITQEAVTRLPELAERTKNFTGAEIEGLVKASVSYALSRCIDVNDISKAQNDTDIVVGWQDFERALDDVQPAFGAPTQELQAFYSNGIINYGSAFTELEQRINSLIQQVRNSDRTPLMSLLLEGSPRSGKTALAARAAIESGFPFVRMISADTMIGLPENVKCANILKVFNDSYKSPLSIIFIDDIERIIDYTPIGPRFSNMVLQTLLVLLRKIPPEGRKLFVVATTSISHLLEDLQLVSAFTVQLHVSELQDPSETKAVLRELLSIPDPELDDVAGAITKPIGIKQLLIVTEMARQENDMVTPDTLMACLHTCGF